jgi:hypothetical protein
LDNCEELFWSFVGNFIIETQKSFLKVKNFKKPIDYFKIKAFGIITQHTRLICDTEHKTHSA